MNQNVKLILSVGLLNLFCYPNHLAAAEMENESSEPIDSLVELAHSPIFSEAFSNVGMLTATIELPFGAKRAVFGASAVYVGGLSVVTNAHCVVPWLDLDGNEPDGKFYSTTALHYNIVSKDGKIVESHPLQLAAKIHPLYKSHKLSSQGAIDEEYRQFDIAILTLKNEISSLQGIFPYMEEIEDIESKEAYCCGFGASGDVNQTYSAIDRKKRAIYIPYLMSCLPELNDKTPFPGLYSAYLGRKLMCHPLAEPLAWPEDNNALEMNEGGMRTGMSGGMLLVSDGEDLFIGLPCYTEYDLYDSPFFSEKYLYGNIFRNKIGWACMKYLALLFPTAEFPGMNPMIGDLYGFVKFSTPGVQEWLLENLEPRGEELGDLLM